MDIPSFNIASCRNFDSNNDSLLLSLFILLLLDEDCCIAAVVVKYRDCWQLLKNILCRRRTEEVIVDARRLDDLLVAVVDIIIHADAIGNVVVVIVG